MDVPVLLNRQRQLFPASGHDYARGGDNGSDDPLYGCPDLHEFHGCPDLHDPMDVCIRLTRWVSQFQRLTRFRPEQGRAAESLDVLIPMDVLIPRAGLNPVNARNSWVSSFREFHGCPAPELSWVSNFRASMGVQLPGKTDDPCPVPGVSARHQSYTTGRCRQFTDSPIHPFTHSPIHRFPNSPIHPFTDSPIHPFTDSPIHRFTHSPIGRLESRLPCAPFSVNLSGFPKDTGRTQ